MKTTTGIITPVYRSDYTSSCIHTIVLLRMST